MENEQVAQVFSEMAGILAVQGANAHRILAYRRAAERIAALDRSLASIWRAGELEALPGIGKILATKIDELMRTGRLEALEKRRAEVPVGVTDLLRVPGVGPKRAALFWRELGITSIEALGRAAREGRLRSLPRIGEQGEAKILAAVEGLAE